MFHGNFSQCSFHQIGLSFGVHCRIQHIGSICHIKSTCGTAQIFRFLTEMPGTSPAAATAIDTDTQTTGRKYTAVIMQFQNLCKNSQLFFIFHNLKFRNRKISVQNRLGCSVLKISIFLILQTNQCRCQNRNSELISLNNSFFFTHRARFHTIFFHTHKAFSFVCILFGQKSSEQCHMI